MANVAPSIAPENATSTDEADARLDGLGAEIRRLRGARGLSAAALARAGLTLDQIDVIEANEAFAAQACAVSRELGFDPAKVNPNGSGISLGHPIGATGALITVKALHELRRVQGRHALVTMCIGGGQGIAAIFERLSWHGRAPSVTPGGRPSRPSRPTCRPCRKRAASVTCISIRNGSRGRCASPARPNWCWPTPSR